MLQLSRIDHIVLTVRDIQTTVQFYESVLGMRSETFGAGRVALKFGQQKINLHEYGKEFEPKARQPLPGSEDLCFITDTSIPVAMDHVQKMQVDILEGPVSRTGAIGNIVSFYFRDPDLNLIEIASYQ
jgi:catechol 2,3-dioxygenase-like lactoylglutathione lyase family enzyme